MYMFQSLKSFKIKALCTKSETLKRLCPIEFIIAKTICTNFQNEMCKNRHFFAVCLPVLEYHLKGF